MERIDSVNHDPNGNGEGKRGFHGGNYSIGVKATYWTPKWANYVQEEIANVIEGFGVALDGTKKNQMFEVLAAKIGGAQNTKTITDWNLAVTNGIFMGNDAANAPFEGWCLGNVVSHNSQWLTQYVHKFTDDVAGNSLKKKRDCNQGTWGAWVLVLETAQELDAHYKKLQSNGIGGYSQSATLTLADIGRSAYYSSLTAGTLGLPDLTGYPAGALFSFYCVDDGALTLQSHEGAFFYAFGYKRVSTLTLQTGDCVLLNWDGGNYVEVVGAAASQWQSFRNADNNYNLATYLNRNGQGLNGALRILPGPILVGNPNNVGITAGEVGVDTGVAFPRDGKGEFVSNGEVIASYANNEAFYVNRAVSAPKGLPVASDTSYSAGFVFGGDKDTGVYARGGSGITGSDVCLVNDTIVVASARSSDKRFVVETVLEGNCDAAYNTVTPYSALAGETGSLPQNTLATIMTLNFTARGTRCEAMYHGHVKTTAVGSSNEAYCVIEIVRMSDGTVMEAGEDAATCPANLAANSIGKLIASVETAQLVKGEGYQARVRAFKTINVGVVTLLRNRLRVLTF